MSETDFTPRKVADDRTVDGVLIEVGLRVVDYDRKHGEVIELGTVYGENDPNGAWHRVRRDDGTTGSFDRTRLHSERNYRPGL